jgi:serpin B
MKKMFEIVALVIALALASAAAAPDPGLEEFVQGNLGFAFDLYAQLSTGDGNVFFSPYSISAALGMTYAGAVGETAAQMRRTLHFAGSDEIVARSFGMMEQRLEEGSRDGGYEISLANSIWGQQGFNFLDGFLQTLEQHYGAGLRESDFAGQTEAARRAINAWVERETRERIKDLIPPGGLTALTRMVLCNAIYFKGDWAEQFNPDRSEDAPFLCADGSRSEATLMRNKISIPYMEDQELQAVELPYQGGMISMLVLLPKVRNGLAPIEDGLNPERWHEILSALRPREVQLSLPRFKTSSQFSLAETLAKMGMPAAFGSEADFSGMNGQRDLYIGAVFHKAFIEVNEEGTEAAAATGVVMMVRALPTPPPVFRADHPFLFALVDKQSGAILFMGRISKL